MKENSNEIECNSIEKNIKILESIIKINNDYLKNVENQTINQKEIKAIEHILSDYKKLREEFKQIGHECDRLEQKEIILEKENNELKYKYNKSLDDLIKSSKENFDLKNKDKNAELLLKQIEKLKKENDILKEVVGDIFNENEYLYYMDKNGSVLKEGKNE